MASIDKELEEELLGAGNKLLDPPSSVDNLLDILIVSTLLFFLSFDFFVLFVISMNFLIFFLLFCFVSLMHEVC